MEPWGNTNQINALSSPYRTHVMDNTKQIRVVLAEDHDRVRQGIRSLLEKTPDVEILAEANNGLEAIRLTKELSPDILLLDVEMPGLNGIEVTRQLKEQGIDVRILILSAYDDQEYILELLDHGVSGYLIKGEAPEHIIAAVHGVAHNENGWVSPQVAMKLEKIKKRPGERNTLTYRELEILRWVVADLDDDQIANNLGVEPVNARDQVDTVIRKLGTDSREGAAEIARREGWA